MVKISKISAIIVEDEPVAREVLSNFVSRVPVLNLVHVFGSATEALAFLGEHKIDLIFLDINLPGMSGVVFYKSLPFPPKVIFTTAYHEYAVEGFELDAVDYLLKPFSFERFLKAVNKVFDPKGMGENQIGEDTLLFKADKRIYPLHYNTICYIEGMGDYVNITTLEKRIMVHETMKETEKRLMNRGFIRIHRSFIINLTFIDYIEGNRVCVNKRMIPLGATYKEAFLSIVANG